LRRPKLSTRKFSARKKKKKKKMEEKLGEYKASDLIRSRGFKVSAGNGTLSYSSSPISRN